MSLVRLQEIGFSEVVMGLLLMRRWLMSKAEGKVLEVAVGTGRNFPYYYRASVSELHCVDVSRPMLERCKVTLCGTSLCVPLSRLVLAGRTASSPIVAVSMKAASHAARRSLTFSRIIFPLGHVSIIIPFMFIPYRRSTFRRGGGFNNGALRDPICAGASQGAPWNFIQVFRRQCRGG